MVSTFQRTTWFPQINLLVQVYDTLWVKWDNIKYSLCLIWNRELNFQHLHLKRVPKPWGYWIFAGGLLCSFVFFFKLGVFTQILSGFQSKWALCGHEAISHTLPQLNCAPSALFHCRPQRFHGALQHVTRVPGELLTNAHGSKIFANVPVGRASAGAGYRPQDLYIRNHPPCMLVFLQLFAS